MSGCAGMLCLIPMAWISFRFLNLTGGITGGLITNLEGALGALAGALGAGGVFLEILFGALIGLVLIFLFPIHWCIFYRPDDIMLIVAVTIPWILCCVITSGLFAHTPRGGLHTSLAIGIGYAIILSVVYIILMVALPFGPAIIDGLLTGLTDLPYLLATLTAVLEGCLVGAIFGSFIGALKYKPGGKAKVKKVKKAKKKDKEEDTEMFVPDTSISSATSTDVSHCTNCGAKITGTSLFCTSCGAKI